MLVRRAGRRDLAGIQALWEQLREHEARIDPRLRPSTNAAKLASEHREVVLGDPRIAFFVCEHEGELVAFLHVQIELLDAVRQQDPKRVRELVGISNLFGYEYPDPVAPDGSAVPKLWVHPMPRFADPGAPTPEEMEHFRTNIRMTSELDGEALVRFAFDNCVHMADSQVRRVTSPDRVRRTGPAVTSSFSIR